MKATRLPFQQILADTKISTTSPTTGPRAQALHLTAVESPGTCSVVYCSGLLLNAAPLPPARSSPPRSSTIWNAGVSMRDLSGRPTTAQSSSAVMIVAVAPPAFPPAWATASTSASCTSLTPSRATFTTVHRLVEKEFFDLESFSTRGDFLAKALTYLLYLKLVRPSSHKQNLSPWQVLEHLAPASPMQPCLLPPVLLDYYLNDSGGYDLSRLP